MSLLARALAEGTSCLVSFVVAVAAAAAAVALGIVCIVLVLPPPCCN